MTPSSKGQIEHASVETVCVAVIMTLYRKDSLAHFELAISSLESQVGNFATRIYLCCDGPLTSAQDQWLALNTGRFYKIIKNEHNVGLAKSLNNLIDILEDEAFVFRMDGDDISLNTRFAKQIELMRENPQLALIGCQAQDIDEDGAVLGQRSFPVQSDAVESVAHKLNPVLHPTYCFRASVLADRAVRYPEAHLCEDLAMLVILLERGYRIANHPDLLFQWRIGDNFFKRRQSFKRGVAEGRWYWRAMRVRHHALSPQAAYPLARFVLRVLPAQISNMIYRSPARQKVSGS